MMRTLTVAALALAIPAAVQAQDHQDHSVHQMQPAPEAAPEEDHSQMDHSQMDHGAAAEIEAARIEQFHEMLEQHRSKRAEKMLNEFPMPVTVSAGINAADSIWGADAMRASRQALYDDHGDMTLFWFQADRFELRSGDGEEGHLWDLQAYYGGDIAKLWLKSEGEGSFGEAVEDAEIQVLYSRAVAPFWDVQAGIRQDLTGPERTYAVLGLQGLAPYEFEVDGALFLSTKGNLTARIEAEYDQRITQRLILQPRIEANLAAQDVAELSIGAGLDSVEAGVRLRYEILPEFAPYVGIEQEWKIGGSRDYAIASGEDAAVTAIVVGIRFWF